MRVNPKYIEVLGDTIIPVMGYFLWSWNLYFIVLFFLLELLFSEGINHIKANKIHSFKPSIRSWLILGTVSAMALCFNIFFIHVAFNYLTPSIDFKGEIIAFLTYEDMGLAQGYVLFPLLFISGYQKYKLEFIRLKKHETLTIQKLWRTQLTKYVSIFILIALCFLLMLTGINSIWIYLMVILVASAAYKLFSFQT